MALAARRARRYCLYVSGTQEQADSHVENIGMLLGDEAAFIRDFPDLAERKVDKYGNSRGWRRNRLWTRAGFIVDAAGLDTNIRGVKKGAQRPDLIIFDDVDSTRDSAEVIEGKIQRITTDVLPARSEGGIFLVVQNVIRPDGFVGRLVSGEADYLTDAYLNGPIPAVRGLTYEQVDGRYVITGGEPTWRDLAHWQAEMDISGLSAFLRECQHEVDNFKGGLFEHIEFRHCAPSEVPDLDRVSCWVDPAVTSTDGSDCAGIQIDGIARDGTIYRLWSWEQRAAPLEALTLALQKAIEYGAEAVGVETDQGGDTWQAVYVAAAERLGMKRAVVPLEGKDVLGRVVPLIGPLHTRIPRLRTAKAGQSGMGKAERIGKMLADYERGRIVHVTGTHGLLERALKRFPVAKPFDLADAAYWAWRDLRATGVAQQAEYAGGMREQRGYMKDRRYA